MAAPKYPFPIPTPARASLLPSLAALIDDAEQNAVEQDKPFLIHTIGVPGSGKSSLITLLAHRLNHLSPSTLAFDKVMEAMPEYRAESDLEKAFARCELPARAAGYLLLKTLMEKRANILFDNTASAPAHVELVCFAKTIGYRVLMLRVHVDPTIAKARLTARQGKENRYTPAAYVDDRLAAIETLSPTYQTLADAFITIANNSQAPEAFQNFLSTAAAQTEKALRNL